MRLNIGRRIGYTLGALGGALGGALDTARSLVRGLRAALGRARIAKRPSARHTDSVGTAPSILPFRVLVVEDDADFIELLRVRVGKEAEIFAVPTLKAAFQAARARSFDLTLLDLKLPDAPGGVGTVIAARGLPEPIVVLTGLDDREGLHAAAARAAGATEWVSKDLEPHLLVRILRVARASNRLSHAWLADGHHGGGSHD